MTTMTNMTTSPVNTTSVSVLIVDDHVLLSQTISSILEKDGDCSVDVALNLDEALKKITDRGRYDVVLFDYQLPGAIGLQGLRQVIELNQGGTALFSGVAGLSIAQAAMEQGASGFIPKSIQIKTLLHAINSIASGELYFPTEYLLRLSNGDSPSFGLKPRELRVLAYLSEGLQNKEIGREVGIEEVIVKMDVKSICRKLGVRNRTEAALAARKLGLV